MARQERRYRNALLVTAVAACAAGAGAGAGAVGSIRCEGTKPARAPVVLVHAATRGDRKSVV